MYSKFVNQLKEEINSNMPIKNVQNEDFKFSSEFLIFTISIHIFLKYTLHNFFSIEKPIPTQGYILSFS